MHIFLDIASLIISLGLVAVTYFYANKIDREFRADLAETRYLNAKGISSLETVLRVNYDSMNKRLQILEEAHNKKVKAAAKKPA